MKKQLIIIGMMILLLIVGLSGCNDILNDKGKFVGKWSYLGSTAWIFRDDGTCQTPLGEGTYNVDKGKLIVEVDSIDVAYDYTFLDIDNKLNGCLT